MIALGSLRLAKFLADQFRAAQLCFDASEQFTHGKRLGQVVIRAHLQTNHAVDLVVAGGQHEDRHRETEIADLADQGVAEVTLLGQNVNAYRGPLPGTDAVADFAMLIETVAEVPGIERIRYTTSHPNEMSPRLIAVYGKVGKLVSHLHLPVQSGSDRILAAMKRGYTVLEYKSIIRKLRAVRPELSLSSDFIVGFPGETDEDFDFEQAIRDIHVELASLNEEAMTLAKRIQENFEELGA